VISADRWKRCPAGTMDAVSPLFGLCCLISIGKHAASDWSAHPPYSIMGGPTCRSRREAWTLRATGANSIGWRASEVLDIKRPNREAKQSGLRPTLR
jgi:hypothetical protein